MQWEKFSEDPDVLGSSSAVMAWGFRPPGQAWPVVSVAFYDNFMQEPGVRLSINRKNSEEHHWVACNLPNDLIDSLRSMLLLYSTKNILSGERS